MEIVTSLAVEASLEEGRSPLFPRARNFPSEKRGLQGIGQGKGKEEEAVIKKGSFRRRSFKIAAADVFFVWTFSRIRLGNVEEKYNSHGAVDHARGRWL